MKYTPTAQELARIRNAFTYHPPATADQPERYERIREMGRLMAEEILTLCPSSRELSLAITNLEQTVFWANAAIARHDVIGDSPA